MKMKIWGSCSTSTSLIVLLLLMGCLHLESIKPGLDEDLDVGCAEKDRKALLEFKEGLNDFSGWLSSWEGKDCCKWRGVGCNKKTGHVVKLDLKNPSCYNVEQESVGQLSELVMLDLSVNSWEGVISEVHFLNLTRLEEIYISLKSPMKSLVFHSRNVWIPPFSLKSIMVDNVQIGTSFPPWLQTQKELVEIELHNVGISDTVPDGFWKLPDIKYLDLSNNQIRGRLPNWMNFSKAEVIYLSFNFFSGPLPMNIGEIMPRLKVLDLYGNNLNDSIPYSIGILKDLVSLFLSNNQFIGELPGFWKGLQNLQILAIANNNFTGNIPGSMGFLLSLELLLLNNNNLDGELPLSLQNCTNLDTIDLGEYRFCGNVPNWI
ncbi:hypothetical protein HHK36_027039 [Tetracentron sinense]|uniref:Leucine-rich repeat-containing N-terminal plant-type domain-containing protein n=1 Tax=Tetracentron sinense TaxID=13715 RepID=A0A834YKJ8_TETSI|nr:hypothetical protein HHK36_027039 [Tetracentron sinense]